MPFDNQAITLATFGDLLRHGYRLAGHCRRCSVHREIDLGKCPAGRSYIDARFKCRDCAGLVSITVSRIVAGNDQPLDALDRWRKS